MPRRMMSGARSPAMSSRSSSTRPASGRNAPVIRLKNVVLPAPFGPITAVSEPASKCRLTSFMATTPPNDLRKFSTVNMGALGGRSRLARCVPSGGPTLCPQVGSEPEHAAPQPEREQKDDGAEHQAVVLGEP